MYGAESVHFPVLAYFSYASFFFYDIRGFPFIFSATKNFLELSKAIYPMLKSPDEQAELLRCLAGGATRQFPVYGTGK